MTKNTIFLSIVAVALGAAYVVFFTDLFAKKTIQIIPSVRPGRASAIPRQPGSAPVCPVSFAFDGKYRFTSIKVMNADEMKSNKYAQPLWHLVAESNSAPVKAIMYGAKVSGMKPAIAETRPQPLEPEVVYTLFVEAGNTKAQTNFTTKEMMLPGRN
jgi:hypothetical protein